MDGTGRLFAPLLPHLRDDAVVVDYPPDRIVSYDERSIELPPGPVWLLGESYSGPLAIRLAARHPERVCGLVLCASFARHPYPSWLAPLLGLPLPTPLPTFAARRLLTGRDGTDAIVALVRGAVQEVQPAVLRQRVQDVLRVDVRADLADVRCPVLYLQAAHDRLVPPGAAAEVVAAAPQTEVVVFDTPHLLLQSAPQRAAGTLNAFAARAKTMAGR